MIVLITGASHTGKTVLAQKLLEKYKYPYLSIDHLKMGLIRSGYTKLTPEDDDKLTEYQWPIVREINIRYYCLVMSESYIKNNFDRIKKYASAVENRIDDEWCTMENVLEDNVDFFTSAKKHNVNIVVIDDSYEIISHLEEHKFTNPWKRRQQICCIL